MLIVPEFIQIEAPILTEPEQNFAFWSSFIDFLNAIFMFLTF